MKRVTLYKAVPEVVNAFGAHIMMHEYQKGIRCRNSDDWFHADQVKIKRHSIPIVRYCYRDENTNEEWFTAFDPELQRLIDMQVNERIQKYEYGNRIVSKVYQDEIDRLRARSYWDILITNIKNWWKK